MKSVSWDVAFRKLNVWRERESTLAFGPVLEIEDAQGETNTMFSASSGTRVLEANSSTGEMTLLDGTFNLVGAVFKSAGWEDSPLYEEDLGPEEFKSLLEISFPDGKVFLLAEEWPVH
jgi:hypothetical protein